jgi:hypothetical protein
MELANGFDFQFCSLPITSPWEVGTAKYWLHFKNGYTR